MMRSLFIEAYTRNCAAFATPIPAPLRAEDARLAKCAQPLARSSWQADRNVVLVLFRFRLSAASLCDVFKSIVHLYRSSKFASYPALRLGYHGIDKYVRLVQLSAFCSLSVHC